MTKPQLDVVKQSPPPHSLSAIILKKRLQQKITLEEAEQQTKIPKKYLSAIEQGDYEKLPAPVYTHYFLKNYLTLLGLEPISHINLYEHEFQKKSQEKFQTAAVIPNNQLRVTSRLVKMIAIAFFVVLCLGFLGLRLQKIITPPFLNVISPPENFVTDQSLLEIQGQTEQETKITINEYLVVADENGNFRKIISLQPGLNTFQISSQKKYSRPQIVARNVIFTVAATTE